MNSRENALVSEYTRASFELDKIVIEVAIIKWPNPSHPVKTWHSVFEIPANSNPKEIATARHQLLKRRKYFKICQECGERKSSGYMFSVEVCQSCASNNHGIVF